MSDGGSGTESDEAASVDRGQLVVAVVAMVGLVVVGVVVVPGSGNWAGGGETGGSSPIAGAITDFLKWLFDGDGGGDPACRIALHSEPVPGDDLTVTITVDDRPVEGATVWYNDRRVGTTDRSGSVTGEVPYTRQLRIRVVGESVAGCEAEVDRFGPASSAAGSDAGTDRTDREPLAGHPSAWDRAGSSIGGVTAPATGSATAPAIGDVTAPGTGGAVAAATGGPTAPGPASPADATGPTTADASVPGTAAAAQSDDDLNESEQSVRVRGRVDIRTSGDPYPGETIGVVAAIEGVPVSDGEVKVGGERVGRTDEDGRARITVPEDAEGTLPVTVERGDFSGTVRVRVLDLSVSLRTDRFVLAPGGPADVVATVGDRPASDAELTVAGERQGSVGGDGREGIRLPMDPRAEVVVTTERQTASVSLLDLYAVPLFLFGGAVVVVSALAGRRFGVTGVAAVALPVTLLVAVALVDAYLGRTASQATAGMVVGGAVLTGAVLRRRRIAGVARRAYRSPGGVVEWLLSGVLLLVTAAEWAIVRVGAVARRLVGWVRSLPRSVPALARRLLRWLWRLPARVRTTLARLPVTPTTVGAAVAVVLLALGAYDVAGTLGVAAVLGAVLVLVVLWLVRSRTSPEPDLDPAPTDDGDPDPPSPDSGGESLSPDRRSIRELWRAFARRVVPGRWRTRTPVEVGRRAVGKGVPERPVLELTAAFRAVEYGNREPTEALVEGANDAYRDLADHLPGGDADDTSGDAGGGSDDAADPAGGSGGTGGVDGSGGGAGSADPDARPPGGDRS
ncbi:hypothetical protein BRD00_05185 [Halobacteriales archaeon QS_8_69_26]|nr:MAG: hypothetical protein BRD00_05185 [Halobacteriales archaeon QS_8_69_26]